jgi:hypothetical protein
MRARPPHALFVIFVYIFTLSLYFWCDTAIFRGTVLKLRLLV